MATDEAGVYAPPEADTGFRRQGMLTRMLMALLVFDAFVVWPGTYLMGHLLAAAAGLTAMVLQAQMGEAQPAAAPVIAVVGGAVALVLLQIFAAMVVWISAWPVTALVWCVWTAEVVWNHNWLHPSEPISPVAAVGLWFIPLVNLAMPLLYVWRLCRQDPLDRNTRPTIVGAWWLSWVVVLCWVSIRVLWTVPEPVLAIAVVITRPVIFALAVLSYFIVSGITRQQQAAADAMQP